MKRLLPNTKLIVCLALSLIISILLWLGQQQSDLILAQHSPIRNPVVGDIIMYAHKPPVPPTPTATRIPDTRPPDTTLKIEGAENGNGWYRTPVTLTFETVDDWVGMGLTWYKFSHETNWQDYEYYYPPIVVNTEGMQTLQFYSEDNNFNTELTQLVTLNIDLTPPTATHTIDGVYIPNGWYGSPVTLDLTGQDNLSGVDHYEINLNDGKGWQPVTSTPTISVTGHYTLAHRTTDKAGNVSPEEIITLDVDLTPPTTTHTLTGTQTGSWYTSPVTATLTAVDVGAGVFQILYRLDGGPAWWIYGGPFVIDTDGSHTLEYYATDRANNIESQHTVTFNIDQTPPASAFPTITGIKGHNDWYTSPITITLSATDTMGTLERIEYNWQHSGWLTYTTPLTTNEEGRHPLAYRAIDATGHIEAAQVYTALVDLHPPQITITPLSVLTLTHLALADIYTATDNMSGLDSLSATLNGMAVQPNQGLPLGTSTLIVTAVDQSGWQSTASQMIVVEGRRVYLPLILKSPLPPCFFPPFCW